MPDTTSTTDKMIAHLKGFRDHLQPDEQPIMTMPAIWDSGQGKDQQSEACDVVLTNQRLIGYYFKSFPRQRLFFEAFTLTALVQVTLQQKTYEPIFREILLNDNRKKVYVRATRQKIELLYKAIRATIGWEAASPDLTPENLARATPRVIFGRTDIRTEFERSPLAITMLFAGGIILEIIGALVWAGLKSPAAGLPLCIAGFIAVITAMSVRKRKR